MYDVGSDTQTDGFVEKLVQVNRTAKVEKGGRIFRFSALVLVGDKDGKVGFGFGKAREVPAAIQKATENARRNIVTIQLNGNTLYHQIKKRYCSSTVIMVPASEGTGVIAGNAMRAVFEVVGVENVLAKCLGSTNPVNVVRATIRALQSMSTPESIAAKRGKSVQEIWESVIQFKSLESKPLITAHELRIFGSGFETLLKIFKSKPVQRQKISPGMTETD